MRYGFTVRAWVILPDHFHLILNVTNGCFADIIHGVKISFSAQYRKRTEQAGPVWQHRYWDHIIRSQEDMNRHIDYMHYNPIKHGMVDSTQDYRLSSFGEFCSSGLYEPDWRTKEFEFQDKEFGE
jgi:putative transposase